MAPLIIVISYQFVLVQGLTFGRKNNDGQAMERKRGLECQSQGEANKVLERPLAERHNFICQARVILEICTLFREDEKGFTGTKIRMRRES